MSVHRKELAEAVILEDPEVGEGPGRPKMVLGTEKAVLEEGGCLVCLVGLDKLERGPHGFLVEEMFDEGA